jgi:hypothetical protein
MSCYPYPYPEFCIYGGNASYECNKGRLHNIAHRLPGNHMQFCQSNIRRYSRAPLCTTEGWTDSVVDCLHHCFHGTNATPGFVDSTWQEGFRQQSEVPFETEGSRIRVTTCVLNPHHFKYCMSFHLIHNSTYHYWHFDENQQCHQLPAMANLS